MRLLRQFVIAIALLVQACGPSLALQPPTPRETYAALRATCDALEAAPAELRDPEVAALCAELDVCPKPVEAAPPAYGNKVF
jgi:hypothetical protein